MGKSTTLRSIVLALFNYRLMTHNKFSITFKSELLLGQSKTSTTSRRSRSLVFAACGVHGCINAWTWLLLQRVVVKVWHSLSVEGLDEILPSGHVCPGSRPMVVCNYGKGTITPWRKRLRRHVRRWTQAGRRCLKGRFWRPQGSPYRAYLAGIPRTVLLGISKARPMAAAFITATEVPTTRQIWASAVLSVAVWRKYCLLNATAGRKLLATVTKLPSWLRWKMAKIEGYKLSQKYNEFYCIYQVFLNKPEFWKLSLCHIWNAVLIGLNIWHHFLFRKNAVLLPNYIISKIKNIPPIGKFSKIKQKKAITFDEKCMIITIECFSFQLTEAV